MWLQRNMSVIAHAVQCGGPSKKQGHYFGGGPSLLEGRWAMVSTVAVAWLMNCK